MYTQGDILVRTRNFYDGVGEGTKGEVIRRIKYDNGSLVLVLSGPNRGEKHVWSDIYIELYRKLEPTWKI